MFVIAEPSEYECLWKAQILVTKTPGVDVCNIFLSETKIILSFRNELVLVRVYMYVGCNLHTQIVLVMILKMLTFLSDCHRYVSVCLS